MSAQLRDLFAHLAAAHNALHRGDEAAAHESLHHALHGNEPNEVGRRLATGLAFDEGFRRLCVEHGVNAMFVRLDELDEARRGARLSTGGSADLCRIIDPILRQAGAASRTKPL